MNTDAKSKQNGARKELEWVVNAIGPETTRDLSQVESRKLAALVVESVRRKLEQEQTRSAALKQALENIQSQVESAIELSDGPPVGQSKEPVSLYSQGSERRPLRRLESLSRQVEKWQKRRERWPDAFAREARLLQTLAETGESRRIVAAKMLAGHLGLNHGCGSIVRTFVQLERSGWIELIAAKSETIGAVNHYLLRLTDRGVMVCKTVLELNPAPSQLTELLSRHQTPSRVLLVLQTADLLREAGYTVDLFPNRIALSGNSEERTFAPDLVASWRGSALLVLVAGKAGAEGEVQRRRWRGYYDAAGGEFHVVTPSPKREQRVKGDVWDWAHLNSLRPELWMTNISDVRGQGLRGNEIWTREPVYPCSLAV